MDLKNLYFVLLIFIIGCQGSSTQKPAPKATANKPAYKALNKSSIASPEEIAKVKQPELSGPAKIVVKIKGVQPGTAKMIGRYGPNTFLQDSTTVNSKGEFTFEKKEGYPMGMYYLTFNNEQNNIITFVGKDQQYVLEGDLADIGNTLKVTGSDDNQAFIERLAYTRIMDPKFQDANARLAQTQEGTPEHSKIKEEQNQLSIEWRGYLQKIYDSYPNSLYVNYTKASQNPLVHDDVSREEASVLFRQEFWDDVNFADRRLLRTDIIENKLKSYFNDFTPQQHDSIFSSARMLIDKTLAHPEYYEYIVNWVMLNYDPKETTLMDPEFVYYNMVNRYYKKDRVFWLDSMQVYGIQNRAAEMGNSLMGSIGPDVTAKDQFGKEQSLMSKTADYLIVYLFAPSCEHCQVQTPKLVDWYHEWKNKGADVYSIAIDTDDKEWKDYIKKTKMPFTTVHDPTNRSIYKRYFVDVTPELYVLNKERKIIGKNLKVFQIETVIDRDKRNNN